MAKPKTHRHHPAPTGHAGTVTYNPTSWARRLLADLGAPVTSQNVRAVRDWEHHEGGQWANTARFNPLNTTQREPGSVPFAPGAAVQAYGSWGQGLAATVQTLKYPQYVGIDKALAAGTDAATVERAVTSSPWGTTSLAVGEGDGYNPSSSGPAGTSAATGNLARTIKRSGGDPAAVAGAAAQVSGSAGSTWVQALDDALNPGGFSLNPFSDAKNGVELVAIRGGFALAGAILLGMGLFLAFGHDIFGGLVDIVAPETVPARAAARKITPPAPAPAAAAAA